MHLGLDTLLAVEPHAHHGFNPPGIISAGQCIQRKSFYIVQEAGFPDVIS